MNLGFKNRIGSVFQFLFSKNPLVSAYKGKHISCSWLMIKNNTMSSCWPASLLLGTHARCFFKASDTFSSFSVTHRRHLTSSHSSGPTFQPDSNYFHPQDSFMQQMVTSVLTEHRRLWLYCTNWGMIRKLFDIRCKGWSQLKVCLSTH